MEAGLQRDELVQLIRSVFSPSDDDRKLAILIDLPDEVIPDNDNWQQRRNLALLWCQMLQQSCNQLNLEAVDLFYYPNVHSNNSELPATIFRHDSDKAEFPLNKQGKSVHDVLANYRLIIALTELSATAPLKVSAPIYGFRAVTMPGFSKDMIPALRLDYELVHKRIMAIKQILDESETISITFQTNSANEYNVLFDTRFRSAHASSGRFLQPGTAGNLPGGECYIVPYEGENGESSRSFGILPVQIDNEIVLFRIENNRAIEVISTGSISEKERQKLNNEPAYGNMAEIGFGILRDLGIRPIGQILLDEKLGLHIAFGRSDHFGGAVGPSDFIDPEQVIHLDRIYIPETQPAVIVKSVIATYSDGTIVTLIKQNNYCLFE